MASEKRKRKKIRYTEAEDAYLRDHWETSTDEEIAAALGRSVQSIGRRRKKLGLRKPEGRPTKESRKDAILAEPTEHNLSKLSKEDRIDFYKLNFERNPRYEWLCRTLLPEELEYYQTKYIETIDAMDTITYQEEDIVHSAIMKEIDVMRLQEQVKDAMKQYRDSEPDERKFVPQNMRQDLIKAEEQLLKMYEKLRITRQQRLQTDKEEKVNISSLVRSFLDKRNRAKGGKLAGEMQYFKDRCEEEMSKMDFLLGA